MTKKRSGTYTASSSANARVAMNAAMRDVDDMARQLERMGARDRAAIGGQVMGHDPRAWDAMSPRQQAEALARIGRERVSSAGVAPRLQDPRGGNKVRRVADQVAKALRVPVTHSTSAGGHSSYLDFGTTRVRISDHGLGSFRTHTEGAGYRFDEGAHAIIKSIKGRLARGRARAAKKAEEDAARAAKRAEATAPIRAEQKANREAKLRFFEERGLTTATETAKKKAWKKHRKSIADGSTNKDPTPPAAKPKPKGPTVKQLRADAKAAGVKGTSRMRRGQLLDLKKAGKFGMGRRAGGAGDRGRCHV